MTNYDDSHRAGANGGLYEAGMDWGAFNNGQAERRANDAERQKIESVPIPEHWSAPATFEGPNSSFAAPSSSGSEAYSDYFTAPPTPSLAQVETPGFSTPSQQASTFDAISPQRTYVGAGRGSGAGGNLLGLLVLIGLGFVAFANADKFPVAPAQKTGEPVTSAFPEHSTLAPDEELSITPPHGSRFVQLWSTKTEDDAKIVAQRQATDLGLRVCAYSSRSVFGTAIGPITASDASTLLEELRAHPRPSVASDALITRGRTYRLVDCSRP